MLPALRTRVSCLSLFGWLSALQEQPRFRQARKFRRDYCVESLAPPSSLALVPYWRKQAQEAAQARRLRSRLVSR